MIPPPLTLKKECLRKLLRQQKRNESYPESNIFPLAAYALAKSGKSGETRAALDELLNTSKTQNVPPYNIALLYNAFEESDKALDWLEKGFEVRDSKMTLLKVDPKWNNLRNDVRFAAPMKRMNL